MSVRSKRLIAGAIAVFLVIGGVSLYIVRTNFSRVAPVFVGQDTSIFPTKGFELLPVTNKAFKAGEKLSFNIIYKGIRVGDAEITVTNGPVVNSRPTLTYESKVETTQFFDSFFKVRDQNISTVDLASLFSLTFDQNLREGHFRTVRHYVFDYINKKVTLEEKKKGKTKTIEAPLQAPLFDVLSALYFVRTRDLTPGNTLSLSIYRDKQGRQLPLTVGSTVKEQKTPFGTFPCARVEPLIQGDSVFKSKGARLVVWMTNDEKKLPVLIEANSSVGIVRIKLTKWEH